MEIYICYAIVSGVYECWWLMEYFILVLIICLKVEFFIIFKVFYWKGVLMLLVDLDVFKCFYVELKLIE